MSLNYKLWGRNIKRYVADKGLFLNFIHKHNGALTKSQNWLSGPVLLKKKYTFFECFRQKSIYAALCMLYRNDLILLDSLD